ncbi:MAG: hypothetical protein H6695_17980 [Deferribacteres bacterium]|nr:hypothetical protein [Deferribacteres bacterium]
MLNRVLTISFFVLTFIVRGVLIGNAIADNGVAQKLQTEVAECCGYEHTLLERCDRDSLDHIFIAKCTFFRIPLLADKNFWPQSVRQFYPDLFR